MKHIAFAPVEGTGFELSEGSTARLAYNGETPTLLEASDRNGQRLDGRGLGNDLQGLPCFTPFCPILTEKGERAVADLTPGDRVVTHDHGLQEVRWVGCLKLGWRALGLLPLLRPVELQAGALGDGLPTRVVSLAPGHGVAVIADGVDGPRLVKAHDFLGRPGVQRGSVQNVCYYQLLLDQHALVNVAGLWCESFRPSKSAIAAFPVADQNSLIEAIAGLAARPGQRSARYATLASGRQFSVALG